MAIKLDMSKAYDRVEWNFLKDMMSALGFDQRWIRLIMEVVSSPSYRIVINGKQGDSFCPSRGIRQGDPLSPLLFVICGEGLSTLLRHAMQNQTIPGISVAKNGTRVNHLMFADDSFLFTMATPQVASALKNTLHVYSACSGQLVNYEKSTTFYSLNTRESKRQEINNFLSITQTANPEKYLGLPTIIGKGKKAAFINILDKIRLKVQAWSTKGLSAGFSSCPLSTFLFDKSNTSSILLS